MSCVCFWEEPVVDGGWVVGAPTSEDRICVWGSWLCNYGVLIGVHGEGVSKRDVWGRVPWWGQRSVIDTVGMYSVGITEGGTRSVATSVMSVVGTTNWSSANSIVNVGVLPSKSWSWSSVPWLPEDEAVIESFKTATSGSSRTGDYLWGGQYVWVLRSPLILLNSSSSKALALALSSALDPIVAAQKIYFFRLCQGYFSPWAPRLNRMQCLLPNKLD